MTDRDLRALSVRCPLCGSHAQAPCFNERGHQNPVPHVARVEKYERINARYIGEGRAS